MRPSPYWDSPIPPMLPVPRYFPSPELASREGIVCVGGGLHPELLLDAYRHGIFPWPTSDDEPLYWFSPDPRAVLPLDGFRCSRRLARRLRSGRYRATCDRAFAQVMQACGEPRDPDGGTWITPRMLQAYTWMHELGYAHSVEVWHRDQLVGGVYGIALGGVFAAESMFHHVRDGSKMALYHLVNHLRARGYTLLDIQQWTPHTGSLGAIELSRDEYLTQVAASVDLPISFGHALETEAFAAVEWEV